jgi:plasmid stabilization system protein ParE
MIPGVFISSRAEQDLTLQYRWYLENADEDIAEHYLSAVDETIRLAAERPDPGRLRRFAAPELNGIRSLQIRRPFDSHLLFYSSGDGLRVECVMHGARDLPDQLVEPPVP